MDLHEDVARRAGGTATDIEAFAATLEEHRTRLAASIRRNWYPGQPVDDIVQETFTRALRARAEYDPTRPLMPWLLRIARNIVVDQQRRQRVVLESLEHVVDPADPDDGPERSYIRGEQIRQMREALAQLPERHRTMLERHCAGDSYELLAICDGVTVASMKSLLNRTRDMLRNVYLDLTDDSTWGVAPLLGRIRGRCRRTAGRVSDLVGRVTGAGPACVAIGWLATSVAATMLVGTAGPVQMAADRPVVSVPVAALPNTVSPDAGAAVRRVPSPSANPSMIHPVSGRAPAVDWSVDHTQGSRDVTMARVTIVPGVGPTDQPNLDIPCKGSITGAIACRVLTHVW